LPYTSLQNYQVPSAPTAAALADATRPIGAAFAAFSEWVSFPQLRGGGGGSGGGGGGGGGEHGAPLPAVAAASALLCGGGGLSAPTPPAADAADADASIAPGLARLTAVAAALAQAGLAVILEDADPATPALTDPAAWAGAWAAVAAAVARGMDAAAAVSTPNSPPRLGVRLLANPDALGLAWDGAGGAGGGRSAARPPLGDLYLSGAAAVSAAAPGAWVLLAGAGDASLPGAGFDAASPGLAAMLSELEAAPYAGRVVISPGLDSPGRRPGAAGGAAAAAAPAPTLAAAYSAAFGHLGARFPIVLGTTGADLADPASAAGLASAVGALAPDGCGLPACRARAGGGHAWAVSGWVWGAWVGGGGEVGGAGGKVTPILLPPPPAPARAAQPLAEAAPAAPPAPTLPPVAWPAIAVLSEGLGLAPWYLPPTAHRRAGGWSGPLPRGVAAEPGTGGEAGGRAADAPSPAPPPPGAPPLDPSGLYSAAGGGAGEPGPPPPAPTPTTCRAAVRVAAAGPAATNGSAGASAGLLVLRLANSRLGGPALAPPYRVTVAGPYAALLAGAGMEGGGVVVVNEGGEGATPSPAITGLVTAGAATLWPAASNEVALALAVRGEAGAPSLAPSAVAINGEPCSLEAVAAAEGGGGGGGPLLVVSAPRRGVS